MLPYTPILGNEKDERVDKILHKNGITDYELFYSPISILLKYSFLILIIAIPFLEFLNRYWPIPLAYYSLGFLFSLYSNNSICLNNDELIIVNPNLSFSKFKRYTLDSINNVKIDSKPWLFLLIFFFIENNYVEVDTEKSKKRFYCSGLGFDAYDENFTEKNIE